MADPWFYERQLLIFGTTCTCAILLDRFTSRKESEAHSTKVEKDGADTEPEDLELESGAKDVSGGDVAGKTSGLTRKYLAVYAVVMGADWLQGPYIYTLYREQYGFPERTVALLFITGFLSAGIAAPFVGVWADHYGRKRLCLIFCSTYALSCLFTIYAPSLPLLLAGRMFGGFSTSILYSAFETWLVSTSTSLHLPQWALSSIMGRATLINGVAATAAGVAANKMVESTGTTKAPFVASVLLLIGGFFMIKRTWEENFGDKEKAKQANELKKVAQAWEIVRRDPVLLILGFTQTCFEGSMYLFVFTWVPMLQEYSVLSPAVTLPFGYIFSAFMVSMMLGSLFYTGLIRAFGEGSARSASGSAHTSSSSSTLIPRTREPTLVLNAKLSSIVCSIGGLSLAASLISTDERYRFWAFCLFEACVGCYFPVMGMLRSGFIAEETRATLSSFFRIPLNIFVVIALLTGVSDARYAVLASSAVVLQVSAILTGMVIVAKVDNIGGT